MIFCFKQGKLKQWRHTNTNRINIIILILVLLSLSMSLPLHCHCHCHYHYSLPFLLIFVFCELVFTCMVRIPNGDDWSGFPSCKCMYIWFNLQPFTVQHTTIITIIMAIVTISTNCSLQLKTTEGGRRKLRIF